jgi:hypothetical protein
MISHTKKFLFIHVPKTGGNSVSTALQTYTDIQFVAANSPKGFGVNENFWPIDPVYGSIKHFSVEQWSTLLGESISDYFLFGTVRNPFDRAISTYFFMKQAMIQNRVPWLEDHSDEARERFSKSEFHNFLVSGVPTQLSFLKSNAGLNIHLMRYERLVEDFVAVSRKLGLNQASLPVINASRRPPSTRLLAADTQKLLIDVYQEDFRSFGYGYEYELERSI